MIRGLVVFAIFGAALASVNQFTWSDCDSDPNRAIKVNSVRVSPMPIVLPGDVVFGFDGSLTKVIQGGTVTLDVKRHVIILGDVHIPCLLGVGSCSYDFCTQLDTMVQSNDANTKKTGTDVKAILKQNNIDITCPVQPQHAAVPSATIHIPDLGAIASVIAAGDYSVKATIKDRSGAIQGCVSFKMELKRKSSGFLFG